MPALTINTNVAGDKVPADFLEQATKIVAASLGKPASYVAVHVNPGQRISFGGTTEPAALCELVSIGALSTDSNKKHSKAIMDYFAKVLGVNPSRVYITFRNTNKADIGFNGTTFDDLL